MLRRIIREVIVFAVLVGFPGTVFGVEWHVTIAPESPDLIRVTVLVERAVHDVWFRVIFLDAENRQIARRDFVFSTEPDARLVTQGKHQQLFRHGVRQVASVEGDFLEYTAVTGAVFAPAMGQPVPRSTLRRVTERVEPSEEEPTTEDEYDDE